MILYFSACVMKVGGLVVEAVSKGKRRGYIMEIGDGETILFVGDSITDCGRGHPVGEGAGLGDGYVNLVNSLMESNYPEIQVRVLNTGISGNRIIDLESRWENDVLNLSPDRLSIFIGINDVWRHFDSPSMQQISKNEFEEVYRKLIEKTREKVKGIVLMTPFYLEKDKSNPMRKMMDEYGAIVRRLAKEYGTVLADVQHAFDSFLKYKPAKMLSDDLVHPNLTGHMIISKCFLKAMGFQWDRN